MNGTEVRPNYSGLAMGGAIPSADYTGVASKAEAAGSGEYQEANPGLKKPFRLPLYEPPRVPPVY